MQMQVTHRTIFLIIWLCSLLGWLLSGCRYVQLPVSPTSASSTIPAALSPTATRELKTTPTASVVGKPVQIEEQQLALLVEHRKDLDTLQVSTHYQIEINIYYDDLTFEGLAFIDYSNNETVPLKQVYFRLFPNGHKAYGNGSLVVTEASVDGQPAESRLSQSDTILEIRLPDQLNPGQHARFELTFRGQVPQDFGGAGTPTGYGIYNYSEGVMALSGWYPILAVYDEDGWNLDPISEIGDSVYSDIALYTVDLTVDRELLLAATGVIVGRSEEQESTRYRLVSGPVRDFFLVLSPDFREASLDVDGTLVRSFYLPEHEEGGNHALTVARDSLAIFNKLFGAYPYTELEVVEAPMQYALGVEYPGIFLVTSASYGDPADTGFAATIAHETAHQWWYNLVGNDVFDDPWLDEALATYSTSLYYQEVFGPAGYRGYSDYLQGRYEELLEDGKDEVVTLSLSAFEELKDPRIYSRVVYVKGALFLKSLRESIGDQAFFTSLQNYFGNQKYRVAQPEDLLSEFEAAAGHPLDIIFQQWLYSKTTQKP